MKYHYFYKITNLINNHFYYGVHNTNNLDDGYMGSGTRLHYAYKKYGIENFSKEILKFFDTAKEAFEYEAEIVTEELVKDYNCYNIKNGGIGWNMDGLATVKDKNGNCFYVPVDDPRIKSGEFVGVTKGMVSVKDNNGNTFCVNKEEYYSNSNLKAIWQDRHHTEKSKQKTRETMTPKNSTNNRIWVNKNGVVKYLLKTKLNEYLDNGWSLGRTNYKPRKNGQGKAL